MLKEKGEEEDLKYVIVIYIAGLETDPKQLRETMKEEKNKNYDYK